MRRTTHLLTGLAALGALVLTAHASAAADGSPVRPAVEQAKAAKQPQIDYVAMGDSYSAGPLVPGPPGKEAMRTDPFSCARSWNNYPAYLAGYLAVSTYTDVTCSGAQTKDFAAPQGTTPYAEPQLDALSAETDLVTIGIGGNDYGLFGSLVDTCGDKHLAHPKQKAPCQRSYTIDGVDTKARDARLIRIRIAETVGQVVAAAPNAEVYVVAYPQLLPAKGTCDAIGFAKGDVLWGNEIERLLNRSLRLGAESHGAHFVSLAKASRGHDACAGKKAWINGQYRILGGAHAAADFHPFRTGERGVAREAYRVITGATAPKAKNAAPPASAIVLNPPYVPEPPTTN